MDMDNISMVRDVSPLHSFMVRQPLSCSNLNSWGSTSA